MQIFKIWGQNVCLDPPNVHPLFLCNKCRAICSNHWHEYGNVDSKMKITIWTPHSLEGNCIVCDQFPRKLVPVRKRKKVNSSCVSSTKQATSSTDENNSSTDTASPHDSDCELVEDRVFCISMDNLQQSLKKIPKVARQEILKGLFHLQQSKVGEEEGASDFVFASQAMAVTDQINLVEGNW